MSEEQVLISERPMDGVAQLTLNRPEKKNALSHALRTELVSELAGLGEDDSVQAVVLTGAGGVFCAGFDLKELAQGDSKAIFAEARGYHHAVHTFPKPLIAAVNGPALAGGMDLALMCDIRLGSSNAQFGQPQVRFGIPAAFALVSSVCDQGTARYLCLTGNVIDAGEALTRGIISERYDDRARLLEESLACAAAIAEGKAGVSMKSSILEMQPGLYDI
ncbi:MAG: enoyl-CoA hydratase/isomerase family protein [Gammaproteobacteria bacterium]|nr:enoyl-CoA hydratase/isomerase family protein [Gammaproteobacteria bacterium]